MIVIQWGCGAPCLMTAMVSSRTGEVFDPPLTVDGTLALPPLVLDRYSAGSNAELKFRSDSRLMIVDATPNWLKPHLQAYRHYYVWQANRWLLVYREPLD
jgi:hypothetical protein